MIQRFKVGSLDILGCVNSTSSTVTYILYPMELLSDHVADAARRFGTSIVVVTGIDWEDDLTPWPAKGVPTGSADFSGEAPEFLATLRAQVIPQAESRLGLTAVGARDLVGVSLSGLFTLWQWLECDLFRSIASLSGSFWYAGFAQWVESLTIAPKRGPAYFLLGDREAQSRVPQFATVEACTRAIVGKLDRSGVKTRFDMVGGDHYSDPLGRLYRGLAALASPN